MADKNTLFHINWGDGDNTFMIAPDEATALKQMSEGSDMVNFVVNLDLLYQTIFKEGRKDVVGWIRKANHSGDWYYSFDQAELEAQVKKWGLEE